MNHSSMPPRRQPARPPQNPPPRHTSHPQNNVRHTQQPMRQAPPTTPHRPQTAQQQHRPQTAQQPIRRPSAAAPHQPTREEIIRRKRYLERKRAEERQRKMIRCALSVLFGILILAILVAAIRSCADGRETPVSADMQTTAVTPPVTTAAPDTTAPPPETEPPAPPKPAVSAVRPMADSGTVTLTEEIDSQYAALIARADGKILAQKKATERMYPASMTKVMTLLVAYEHIDDLTQTFTVTSAIIDPLYRANASLAGFSPAETVTLLDLLYGTVLPSGAEAAVSLAIHVAGSEEAFVKLMNEKAEELGLTDTHFTNCSGLHNADHYSTAVEIAMIMDCAMQYDVCHEILSAYQYTTPPTNKHPEGVSMTSTMLSRMYGDEPDGVTITAGKTGYTPEAGQCLVSFASDDVTGEEYILVTAGAEGKFEPVFDAIEVYSNYT